MQAGAKRALTYAKDGVAPSYFQFKVTDFETLLDASNGRGLPPVKVLAFEESPLPLFLEGPVRYLKTLKKASMEEKRAVYKVRAAATAAAHSKHCTAALQSSTSHPPFALQGGRGVDAPRHEVINV